MIEFVKFPVGLFLSQFVRNGEKMINTLLFLLRYFKQYK